MTITDKNAEIARFMQYDGHMYDKDLKYHSDWNWLHQAISKISELEETPDILGWKRNNWTIFDSPIITAKLETTFDLVYQFVVWHNQQQEL